MLLARAEGLMSSMPTESPGISPVRGEGMVRTPAGNALSLDSSHPSHPSSLLPGALQHIQAPGLQ
jgi:hypothetical protein